MYLGFTRNYVENLKQEIISVIILPKRTKNKLSWEKLLLPLSAKKICFGVFIVHFGNYGQKGYLKNSKTSYPI